MDLARGSERPDKTAEIVVGTRDGRQVDVSQVFSKRLAGSVDLCYHLSTYGRRVVFLAELFLTSFVEPMKATLRKAKKRRTEPHSLDQWSDEDLLIQYRETGRRELFGELVNRYQRELYSYLRRYLGSIEAAEDAFQAVFLQVHLKCQQFDSQRRVRPWLYTIATNQAIDAQRSNRRHRAVSLERPSRLREVDEGRGWGEMTVSEEPDPAQQVADDERDKLLSAALDQLSEPMRSVVHLVYYQGLLYREAAEVLSIPVGTVRSRLHTAIAKLADFWSRHHPDLD